jgi:hypothetical protein
MNGERRSGAERRSQQQGQQQQVHGEGNYQATRDYNRGLKEHMEKHDIEREARDAAPRSEEEARQMEEAERAGKDKARDGGGA